MANSIDRRFDILKQKAAQDSRKQTQESEQGLKRQFSRLGGIGTGAFVKQQQLAKEAGSRRLQEAEQGIEFQRLGEQQRQEDIKGQRAFQTSERLGSQEFSAGQLGKQQAFAKGERLGAQEFGAAQADIARKFQTGERMSSQEFQQGMFDKSHDVALQQLQVAQDTLGMENNVNFLNAKLQIAEGMKKGLFGFDDLNALNSLFGKPDGFSTTSSGSGGSPKGQNIGVEGLSAIRSAVQSRTPEILRSGAISKGAFNRRKRELTIQEGKKQGLTEQDLIRSGLI